MQMWSVRFLSTWDRRETEYRFLWGTENLLESQKPRPQFVGALKVNTFLPLVADRRDLVGGSNRAVLWEWGLW